METIGKFLATPIGSALRVFVGLVIGYLVLDLEGGRVNVTLDELNTWIAAAAAISLPILIAALNPQDPRFGKSS